MFTCDLFVYSQVTKGCCTVPVHRDEEFLQTVILRAENFYFNHYLPATHLEYTKEMNGKTNKQLHEVGLFNKRRFTGVNIINNFK